VDPAIACGRGRTQLRLRGDDKLHPQYLALGRGCRSEVHRCNKPSFNSAKV
jgi:hypothetical protein